MSNQISYQETVQNDLLDVVKDVLGNERFVRVRPVHIAISESIDPPSFTVVEHSLFVNGVMLNLSHEGKGFVDAIWRAYKDHFATGYSSLMNLSFYEFSINALLQKSKDSDAEVLAELTLVNAKNKKFYFRHKSPSSIRSTIQVVAEALEYFMNAELAIIHLKDAITNAQEMHRIDLIEKYTEQMSELVKIMDYSRLFIDKKEL